MWNKERWLSRLFDHPSIGEVVPCECKVISPVCLFPQKLFLCFIIKWNNQMNSQCAVSASKNNNTQHTAQPLSVTLDHCVDLHVLGATAWMRRTLGCYFWMHSLHADCSFNYFLPCSVFFHQVLFSSHWNYYTGLYGKCQFPCKMSVTTLYAFKCKLNYFINP